MLRDEGLIDHEVYRFAHGALFHGSPRYQHNLCIQTNSVVSTTEGRPAVGGTRAALVYTLNPVGIVPAPPDPVAFPVYGSKLWGEVDNVRLLNGPE
jgi:hypothetical protein